MSMVKTKKKFEWWKWDCIDAKVIKNSRDRLEVVFFGFIPSKKNSRRNFWHISIPSETYTEWHKRIINALEWIDWEFDKFPCKVRIISLAGDKVKSDIDNQAQSIFDTFTDLWIIPDDNRFVIQELSIENAGYAKNAYITKIIIEPDYDTRYNINDDHKGLNLEDYIYLV